MILSAEQIELQDFYQGTTTHNYDKYTLSQGYIDDVLIPSLRHLFVHYPEGTERVPLIADVASGDGQSSRRIQQEFAERQIPVKIVQFDISMTGLTRSEGLRVQAKAQVLPLADQSVDLIHFKDAYIHIAPEDRPKLFKEFYRVLKPAGRITLVTQPNHGAWIYYSLPDQEGVSQLNIPASKTCFEEGYNRLKALAPEVEIQPPYYPVFVEDIRNYGVRAGFFLRALKAWIPHSGEKEWHKNPCIEYVVSFQKPVNPDKS